MSEHFLARSPHALIHRIAVSISAGESCMKNSTFETGHLGTALFYYYYAAYSDRPSYINRANDIVERSLGSFTVGDFEKVYGTDSLDNHLSNIGRFIEFANSGKFIAIDPNSYLTNFDEILFQLMKTKMEVHDLDINSGALASGYYFLSRLKSSKACREPLEYLIGMLPKIAHVDIDGDFYWESPSLYGRIYFGLSHGSAMVISFLCSLAEHGIAVPECHAIIKRSVAFVLKHQRSQDKGLFPIQLGDVVESKQFSMCYGDIGVGFALLRAAITTGDEILEGRAMDILLDCAKRTRQDGLTLDASITYGASGLAATFARLNQILAHPDFSLAEKYWYNQIPHYAYHNNEFAGFKTRLLSTEPIWNICFGWGIIGIGISLINSRNRALPEISSLLLIA